MNMKHAAKAALWAGAMTAVLAMGTISASASSGGSGSGGGMGFYLIFMILLFVVMYLILIRPQKKKEKETQAMQRNVQIGDEIVTIGGIVGLVLRTTEDSIVIETGGDRNKLRIKKWAIQENLTVKETIEKDKKAKAAEVKSKKDKKKKNSDDKAEEKSMLKDE